MYIPMPPTPSQLPTPSGSGGTLGSVMQKASRLKTVREEMEMNKWKFQTGVDDTELKLVVCPGCGEESCHYIGGGPKNIECLNRNCQYFQLPPKPEVDDDEDTKEITLEDIDDYGIGFGD